MAALTPGGRMRAQPDMALPPGIQTQPHGAALPGRHGALWLTSAPVPARLMRAAA